MTSRISHSETQVIRWHLNWPVLVSALVVIGLWLTVVALYVMSLARMDVGVLTGPAALAAVFVTCLHGDVMRRWGR